LIVRKAGWAKRVDVAHVIEVAARIELNREKLSVIHHIGKPPTKLRAEALVVLAHLSRNGRGVQIEAELSAEQIVLRNVAVFDEWQDNRKDAVVVLCAQPLEEIAGDRKSAATANPFDEQVVGQAIGLAETVKLEIGRIGRQLSVVSKMQTFEIGMRPEPNSDP